MQALNTPLIRSRATTRVEDRPDAVVGGHHGEELGPVVVGGLRLEQLDLEIP